VCRVLRDQSSLMERQESSGSVGSGREVRARLSQYYGLEDEQAGSKQAGNPYDINGADFQAELYLSRLVGEASLVQLMAQEGEVVRQIQGLDSDMQTLVYENYNKFIAATETIRKMRVDFRAMEAEMEELAASMTSITSSSAVVSGKLGPGRQQVASLSSAHATLQKLQFLLELPTRLTDGISEGRAGDAVEDWARAQRALARYQHMPSFAGIQEDCQAIMSELRERLEQQLADPSCEGEQLGEAVDLLRQLGLPAEQLAQRYLAHCAASLEPHLAGLEVQAELAAGDTSHHTTTALLDPLQFVDEGCNKFLVELGLAVTGYTATFPGEGEAERLVSWLVELLERYMATTRARLGREGGVGETELLVRALDRFYRRLCAASKLLPGQDLPRAGLNLVLGVAGEVCQAAAHQLDIALQSSITDARQALAQPRRASETRLNLQEINTSLLAAIQHQLRDTLARLRVFLDTDTFSGKTYFRSSFCVTMVQQGVLTRHFDQIVAACSKFCTGRPVSPGLLLLLSRTCLDLQSSTTASLAAHQAEQFQLDRPTDITQVNTALAVQAQALLTAYVQAQAADVSLMIRKSVEARDWLSAVEPRSVRAVMKRVVEDVTGIDDQVGQLYEEGLRKVRSSDSSRTLGHRSKSVFSSYANSSNLDSSLASNIQKLFSEKIDYFSPVTASKVSVLTGIIKLGLKTLLECVRLSTFARYGLQQMQVDCHYLQLYLWRFVEDEALVQQLLDEVFTSALHRSLDQPPQLMEASVVEVICDKGS